MFKQRTGEKVDGCAIFWQRNKFEAVEKATVEFYQPGVELLNRDNIGLIVRLQVRGCSDEIVVASTHLLYNPRREDIRLAQMQLLLAELDRVSHSNLPVILTGDFNLQPYTNVYELLSRGQVNVKSVFGSVLVPRHLGITDCCRHSSVLAHREVKQYSNRNLELAMQELSLLQLHHTERNDEMPVRKSNVNAEHKFGTGILTHDFQLRSVHDHYPNTPRDLEDATTHQDDWVTVDYIFYRYSKL